MQRILRRVQVQERGDSPRPPSSRNAPTTDTTSAPEQGRREATRGTPEKSAREPDADADEVHGRIRGGRHRSRTRSPHPGYVGSGYESAGASYGPEEKGARKKAAERE